MNAELRYLFLMNPPEIDEEVLTMYYWFPSDPFRRWKGKREEIVSELIA